MQAAIPDDIKISYAFDQSGYVTNSLRNLLIEGLLGATLTGLMVGLFLKDLRSALIVIINIPLSMLTARYLFVYNRTDHQYHDTRRTGTCCRCVGG